MQEPASPRNFKIQAEFEAMSTFFEVVRLLYAKQYAVKGAKMGLPLKWQCSGMIHTMKVFYVTQITSHKKMVEPTYLALGQV